MGATFKPLQRDNVSHHAKEVWADEKSHLEWDEWKVEGRQGETGMKVLAPALGGNNLGLCSLFHSALPEEEVHGSPGQSRFYLPSYFVATSPLVTPFAGAISDSAEPPLSKTQIWHDLDLFPPLQEEVLGLTTQTHGTPETVWRSNLFTQCSTVDTVHHIVYTICVRKDP